MVISKQKVCSLDAAKTIIYSQNKAIPAPFSLSTYFKYIKICRVWIQTSDLCCLKRPLYQLSYCRGGSPGLVVLGGDLCSECRGFESRHHILDGHNIFSHIFVVGIVMFV